MPLPASPLSLAVHTASWWCLRCAQGSACLRRRYWVSSSSATLKPLPFLSVFGDIERPHWWCHRFGEVWVFWYQFSSSVCIGSWLHQRAPLRVGHWFLGAMVLFYLAMLENTVRCGRRRHCSRGGQCRQESGSFQLCWAFSAPQAVLPHWRCFRADTRASPCSAVLELHAVHSGFNSTAPIPYSFVKFRSLIGDEGCFFVWTCRRRSRAFPVMSTVVGNWLQQHSAHFVLDCVVLLVVVG